MLYFNYQFHCFSSTRGVRIWLIVQAYSMMLDLATKYLLRASMNTYNLLLPRVFQKLMIHYIDISSINMCHMSNPAPVPLN